MTNMNSLENPNASKWTKKDYIDLVMELGGLAKELGICGVIMGTGAGIGYAIGGTDLAGIGAIFGGMAACYLQDERFGEGTYDGTE